MTVPALPSVRRAASILGVLVGLSLSAAALAVGTDPGAPPPPSARADPAPTATAEPTASPQLDPAPECRTAPLEQRAAQVLVVGLPDVQAPDAPLLGELHDLGVGGVLLKSGNVVSADQVGALTAAVQAWEPVAPLVATDEESGRVSSFAGIIGASASPRRLAAVATPQQVRGTARTLGGQLAAMGVDLDLAPVVDLDPGPAGGVIGDRSFSADPHAAAEYGRAFTLGLHDAGVAAAAKHFPGHGRSPADSHVIADAVPTSLEELRRTDLVPFRTQIEAGVPVVLLGHLDYEALDPGLPASLSPAAYRLLRELGFEGVAMTDSLGMGAITTRWLLQDAAVLALDAGADAVLLNQGQHARLLRDTIIRAVQDGRLAEGRLNEAVRRVLELKGLDPGVLLCVGQS